ncbi:MAG TPA: hypothetical protein VNL73_02290 [Verrucomicrobiae bacterium]|nr:hypothetical protein [Verrucomicrobiae bacterium]
MNCPAKTVWFSLAFLLLGVESGWGYPQIFGNYQFNYQRQNQPQTDFNLYNQSLYFNLQDFVMVKNRFLFSAYIIRNEYNAGSKWVDFRPRLDFDLSGSSYKLFFSYLPYRLPGFGGSKTYYRQYHGLANVRPAKWPDLRFNWTRSDVHDNLPIRLSDASLRTWSVGSGWTKNAFNAVMTYIRQENSDRMRGLKTQENNTFNAGAGLNRSVFGSGYFSSNYNYSFNQRKERGIRTGSSNTHSLTTQYTAPVGKKLSFASNYSGRFSFVEQPLQNPEFQDQTLNNSLSFVPVSRMDISLVRGDVRSLGPAARTSQEYWAGVFNYSFPVWQNIDGRISYSKTYFGVSTQGRYFSDVYYLSLVALAYRNLQVRGDLTVNFRSGPLFVESRYQTSRFLDIRSHPLEKLQLNYYYQSAISSQTLVFAQVSSESHNLSLGYTPVPTWSTTLNYLVRYAPGAAGKQQLLSAQIYHTFRNQFNWNVNYGLTFHSAPLPGQVRQSDNFSSQLVIFLERKTVLSLSYSAVNLTAGSFSSNLGATLNQQF